MIQYRTLASTIYIETRFTNIEKVEGTIPWAYLDSVGVPTIGIGFNLRDPRVLARVLAAFGINPQTDALVGNPEAQAREQYYKDRITLAAQASWASTDALRAFLNDTMNMRADDLLLTALGASRERDFEFNDTTDTRIREVFDQVVEDIYEKRVDAWLSGIPDSNERVALVSLSYQGWINVGKSPALKRAIVNNDRAEAWGSVINFVCKAPESSLPAV
jgi:GH24 family phage-related lysozyme (muramidase)